MQIGGGHSEVISREDRIAAPVLRRRRKLTATAAPPPRALYCRL